MTWCQFTIYLADNISPECRWFSSLLIPWQNWDLINLSALLYITVTFFVWYIKDQSQDSIMHTIQLLEVCRDSYVAAIVIRTPKSGKRVCCQTALVSDALLKTYNTWNVKHQGAMCTKYRKLLEGYQKAMDRISIKLRIIQYLRNQRAKQSLE
jgi:hypothetical protein